MYMQELPETVFTTTKVKIKYDCCGNEREMKWVDANKNFMKNNSKHICKKCGSSGDKNPASRPEVRAKMKETIGKKSAIAEKKAAKMSKYSKETCPRKLQLCFIQKHLNIVNFLKNICGSFFQFL